MDVSQLLAEAYGQHRQGRLEQASSLYQQIVAVSPHYADAWHLLGLLQHQQGRTSAAIDSIERAIQHSQPQARLHINLAGALEALGDLDTAADEYRAALKIDPRSSQAYLQLGRLLASQGHLDQATECFQQAVVADPDSPNAHFALAANYQNAGNFDKAVTAYRNMLTTFITDARAHNNLGTVLLEQGRVEEAISSFEHAVAADPQCAPAYFNWGCALSRQGRHLDAAAAYEHFARLRPDHIDAYSRLGEAYTLAGDLSGARRSYKSAVQHEPSNLLWHLRAACVLPPVASTNAEIDQVRTDLEASLHACEREQLILDPAQLASSGVKPPLVLAYQGRNDLELKRLFAKNIQERLPRFEPLVIPTGKPHIGFVVTEGHEGVFLRGMAGVLNRLNSKRLKATIVCSASGCRNIQPSLSGDIAYLVMPADLPPIAAAIREARFDLLYFWEVGTDSVNYFLPLFRTAAVQCTSWGWPVTSGMSCMDYFVSSRLLEPAGAQAHYSERLVALDSIPNYYQRPQRPPAAADREHFDLPQSAHLYLCAQNPRKLHPDMDGVFAEILAADPHALCVLLEANRTVITDMLKQRLALSLGELQSRIRFLPRLGKTDYEKLLATADVVLDSIHYGGGANTTYDTLWQATPLVTMRGEFHRGRYAASAYERMGIAQCTAENRQQYADIAVRLGTDQGFRRSMSIVIRERSGVLFDNIAGVRQLENFFESAVDTARRDGLV